MIKKKKVLSVEKYWKMKIHIKKKDLCVFFLCCLVLIFIKPSLNDIYKGFFKWDISVTMSAITLHANHIKLIN